MATSLVTDPSGAKMSPTPIEMFLLNIDALWVGEVVQAPMRILGSAALMFQADYRRGTKDGDVLGVEPVVGEVQAKLLALAGKGTRLHQAHQVYLDVVSPGLPFLPRPPRWHPVEGLNSKLKHFQVLVLDVIDVVISKLPRFNANDRDDIRAMIDHQRVDAASLAERFEMAVDGFLMDARAVDLPRYLKNLNRVEREFLLVQETQLEFPNWLDVP
jgi:hypothetical protein